MHFLTNIKCNNNSIKNKRNSTPTVRIFRKTFGQRLNDYSMDGAVLSELWLSTTYFQQFGKISRQARKKILKLGKVLFRLGNDSKFLRRSNHRRFSQNGRKLRHL